jgi:hypothetical protein
VQFAARLVLVGAVQLVVAQLVLVVHEEVVAALVVL